MSRLSDIATFLAVVDHGSFSAAARHLGQTPAAVGKRIRQLEGRLGVGLIVRSTRRMALTDAGQRYCDEIRDLYSRIAALEDEIADGSGSLRGKVRMTAPNAFGRLRVVPAIIDFMLEFPRIEIDLALSDKNLDLIEEGFDLAIRTGELADSTLIERRLAPYRRTICAAPAYIGNRGSPRRPADLPSHQCLRLGHERTVADWGLDGETSPSPRLGAGLSCNALETILAACLKGLGVACLPDFLCREALNDRRLTALLPDHVGSSAAGRISILRPPSAGKPRRVDVLIDFLQARLGEPAQP